MKKSLTIYAENQEQLNTLKALMLSLEISFKEEVMIKENSINNTEAEEDINI